MKESYGEDRASHTDPVSFTVTRKGGREALIGACAGGLLSREIILVRGADVVSVNGGVPVVLEQKTTILCKRLYLLAFLKDALIWVGRTRQTTEVGKKTLFMGEIPR